MKDKQAVVADILRAVNAGCHARRGAEPRLRQTGLFVALGVMLCSYQVLDEMIVTRADG